MVNPHAPAPALTVAQSGAAAAGEIVVWVAALIFALIIGAGLIMFLRNRALVASYDASTDKGIFDSLREMHARGEISDEEFNAARDSMIRRLKTKDRSENSGTPQNKGVAAKAKDAERGDHPTPEEDGPVRVFRAKPGHDLFGRPLPGSGGAGNDGPDAAGKKNPGK